MWAGSAMRLFASLASSGKDRVATADGVVLQFGPAEKSPDGLDRVRLRRLGRQRQQGEGFRHSQLTGGMPAGLVEHEDRMRLWGKAARDLVKMGLHRLRVGTRRRLGQLRAE